jgi:hypothetical protein
MWKETSAEVYYVIHAKHKKDLSVHSSFSDTTGNGFNFSTGIPEMITEWGFKDSDVPLLKVRQTKVNEYDKEWNCEFFIYLHKE